MIQAGQKKYMSGRWILFRLEFKKFVAMLPVVLAETILVSLVLAGIGFCATGAVYGEKAADEIRAGIVTQGEDSLTEMLIRFVESMDSIRDMVSFVRLSEPEAREELVSGNLSAAILVPEGIVDSVNSGENTPARVLLADDYSRVEAEVFAQFAEAGAKLLTVAQAGIYAADELCMEMGHSEKIVQSENYLNRVYLDYAMGRSSLFKEVKVSAAEGISIAGYYKIALLLAFLSFSGLSFGKSMKVQCGDREKILGAQGIGVGEGYLVEAVAFGCVFTILGGAVGLPIFLLLPENSFVFSAEWLWMGLVWFSAGVFLRLLFQITGNHTGGILLCFGVLMMFMLAGGVFIPTAFLPLWVEKIGHWLPYEHWVEMLTAILQRRFDKSLAVELMGMAIFFLTAGYMMAVFREYGKERTVFSRQMMRLPEMVSGRCKGIQRKAGRVQICQILWKQYFLKHRLWIITILTMSFLAGLFKENLFREQEAQGIAVGICASDKKGEELLSGLLEEKGIFRFQGYDSEEEMLRQIKNGSLECGYFLPEGFYDRVAEGKNKRQATLYYSPSSSVHKISGETVFAELFELLSRDVLEEYLRQIGLADGEDFEEVRTRLYALNNKYAGNGSTFHFIYETGEGKVGEEPGGLNTARGILAVMTFLMGILGLGNVLEQESIWRAMPEPMGRRLRMESFHIATAGSIVTGGAALWLSGNMGEPVRELAGLLVYFIALEVFLMILKLFIRRSSVLYGLLPVIILSSSCFCPVFIRIERYLPQIAWISRIFPPTYYLKMF